MTVPFLFFSSKGTCFCIIITNESCKQYILVCLHDDDRADSLHWVRLGNKMADTPSHHMIYGNATDFVTGETIVDTDDERYRQKLARFLVEERGYSKEDLEVRQKIETLFAGQFVVSKIDIIVSIYGRRMLLLRYGPGSLVTRERPALAAARVFNKGDIIPYVIVTNGEDAELLDTKSGKVIAQGLEEIPDRKKLAEMAENTDRTPGPESDRREKELRILNAFDVEICCAGGPCALPDAPEG